MLSMSSSQRWGNQSAPTCSVIMLLVHEIKRFYSFPHKKSDQLLLHNQLFLNYIN